jgi:hypothetical protein
MTIGVNWYKAVKINNGPNYKEQGPIWLFQFIWHALDYLSKQKNSNIQLHYTMSNVLKSIFIITHLGFCDVASWFCDYSQYDNLFNFGYIYVYLNDLKLGI